MKQFWKIIYGICLLWLTAIPAFSQSTPQTLSDLWDLLDSQNLTLHQLAAQIKSLENFHQAQKSEYFPTIRLQGSAAHVSELARLELPFTLPGQPPQQIEAGVKNQYDLALTAVQPIFTGFRIRNSVKLAEAQLHAGEETLNAYRNQLKMRVARLYYNIISLKLEKEIYKSSQKRWEVALQVTRQRFRQQQAAAFDTLNISRQLIRIQGRLIDLENHRNQLLNHLAEILNLQDVSGLEFEGDNINLPAIRPLNIYIQEALANRAELRNGQWQVTAARLQKDIARASYFPQINASFSYHYAQPGVNFFKDEWMDYYQAGISFSWELWHRGKRRALVRRANWQLKQTLLKQSETEIQIRREVTDAYQTLQNALEQLAVSRKLLEREKERYQLARSLFEKGQIGILDLSATENELTEAELNLNIRQTAFSLAWHNLNFAIGTLGQTR